MPDSINLNDLERRMHGAHDNLSKELAGLRTGRASASLLDSVQVEVYGTKMPLNQCASVAVPEARLLTVQVWDANNAKAVEKAIGSAGLGLNPQPSGSLIRVPLPGLTEERRVELAKIAAKYAEQARISVRNIRREGMDMAKKSKLSEDEQKKNEEKIQKMTDTWIKKIDESLAHKETEIKQV
ncbi:MAG: ribosome recycling factor [Alphaproteobacteria bacterium]|nr:MAG: ribosome recycling factor [Alphaproteobacteria bacterium]